MEESMQANEIERRGTVNTRVQTLLGRTLTALGLVLTGGLGESAMASAAAEAVDRDVGADEVPLVTIRGSESAENGVLEFTVELLSASESTVTVDYLTDDFVSPGPPAFQLASPASDFIHEEGMLTFAPGETSKTIEVRLVDDSIDEPVEAVIITMSNPVNARFEHRRGTDQCPWGACNDNFCCDCGTIRDDDLAELSIYDASGAENAGPLAFSVVLGGRTDVPVTVVYATMDDTAVAGEDYETAAGSLTFPVGTLRRTIRVTPTDDDDVEPAETLSVTLSAPTGAILARPRGTGTILDDDSPTATVAVSDAVGIEHDGALDFAVTLGGAPAEVVEVDFDTLAGSATEGEDYVPVSGTLRFAVGEMRKTVRVEVLDDVENERNETLELHLSNPLNATIGRSGRGIILDDDTPPSLSVAGGSVSESGGALVFPVTLSWRVPSTVTVDFTTTDGSATAGADYRATTGTLTFAPGETAKSIRVDVLDDEINEPEESFGLVLSRSVDAAIDVAEATGTIHDDDTMPTLSVSAASGAESGGELVFTVSIDHESGVPVTVTYTTSNQTAKAGDDYRAASGTLTIPAGGTTGKIRVNLIDDERDEPDETFVLVLKDAVGANVDVRKAIGTIEDDDAVPALSVTDATGPETVGELAFEVTLDAPSGRRVTVDVATEDGTATVDHDYEAVTEAIVFEPGETATTVRVSILDDKLDEPDETFTVVLADPVHAVLEEATATGTITDDDEPPRVAGSPPDVLLCVGGAPRDVDLASLFAGTDLRFGAESADALVATTSLAGGTLEVSPVSEGTTTATVSASNEVGTISVTFGVTVVTDPAELAAVERSLALMGNHLLGSVAAAVGGRFEGQDARPRGNGSPASSAFEPGFRGTLPGFAFDLTGSPGSQSWSLWGHGSGRRFTSEDDGHFDGSLSALHLGVDTRRGDWQAGVAVSVSEAETDYRYERSEAACGGAGTDDGMAGIDVTSIQPYAGRFLEGGGSLWAVVGVGWGEATVRRCESVRGVADLGMGLAAAGGQHPIVQRGGWRLSLVEDIGVIRLDTDEAAGPVGDQGVRAGRARLGVEIAWDWGASTEAFARALARSDWGADRTDAGLDVQAGVRHRNIASRLGFDVGAWMLAAAADGRRESGADLALSMLPKRDGTGLRIALRSRLGGTGRFPMDWPRLEAAPFDGGPVNVDRRWSLDARFGYGVAARRAGGTITPFVDVDASRRSAAAGLRFEADRTLPFGLAVDAGRDTRFGYRLHLHGQMAF